MFFCRFVSQLAVLLLMLVLLGMNLRRSQDVFPVEIESNTNTKYVNELKKYSVEELKNEIKTRQATKIAGRHYHGHLSNISTSSVLRQGSNRYATHNPVHTNGASPGETYDTQHQDRSAPQALHRKQTDYHASPSKLAGNNKPYPKMSTPASGDQRIEQESIAQANNEDGKPKVLWGIFSMNRPSEILRRQCIRKTYLSFYKTLPGSTPSHDYYHRICSLTEYKLWHKNNDKKYLECKMIYAFVMGSNEEPKAPTDLCEAVQIDPSYPLTVITNSVEEAPTNSQKAAALIANETDVVHLNIKENMNQGKSISWFRYGVSLLDIGASPGSEGALYFDYIAKVDGDKLIFPDKFFHEMQVLNLPVPPSDKSELVFGGYPEIYGPGAIQTKWLDGAPFYMSGEMYFLSRELARYVISNGLNRTHFDSYRPNNKRGHEDLSMGKFVFSHPNQKKIVFIKIKRGGRDPIGPHGPSKQSVVSLVMVLFLMLFRS